MSLCDVCSGEPPERELVPLVCIHRICTVCRKLSILAGPCPVDDLCLGKPILYERETLELGIARLKRRIAEKTKDKEPKLTLELAKSIKGMHDAITKPFYDKLTEGFVARPNAWLVGRYLDQPCYFELVDHVLCYYKAGERQWQLPILLPNGFRAVANETGISFLTSGHTALVVVRVSGALDVVRFYNIVQGAFDWDAQVRFRGEKVVMEELPKKMIKEIYATHFPKNLSDRQERKQLRKKKLKQLNADLDTLELYKDYEDRGLGYILPVLYRKPARPIAAISKCERGLRVPTTMGDGGSQITINKAGKYLLRYGTVWLFPHPERPQAFKLDETPKWTINGKCLSFHLSTGEWTAINIDTGEPMEAIPVQYAKGGTRYVTEMNDQRVSLEFYHNESNWIWGD